MDIGAVVIEYSDSSRRYASLPIYELSNSGAVFSVYDREYGSAHLLSADEVRSEWVAWVSQLVDSDQLSDDPPEGLVVF